MQSTSNMQGKTLLIHFLRTRWQTALGVFLLDLLANLCVIALSLLLAQSLAVLFGFNSVRASLIFGKPAEAQTLLMWLATVLSAKFALDYFRLRLRGHLSEDFAYSLRGQAFEQHLRLSPAIYEKRDPGNSLLRFSGDLGSIQRLLTRGVLQFAADLLLVLLGLVLVGMLNGYMVVAVLVLLCFGLLLVFLVNHRLRAIEADRRRHKSRLLGFVSTVLTNIGSIQVSNREQRYERNFNKKASKVRGLGRRFHNWSAFSESLPLLLVQLQLLAVLFTGWKYGLSGGNLFAVALVLMSWRNPLSRMLKAGLVWEKGFLSLEKLAVLMRAPVSISGTQRLLKASAQCLRISHLSLTLGGATIIEDLNFDLKIGEMRCLSGTSGSGKTALVKLLAGVYSPTAGMIEWGDQHSTEIQTRDLRRQVAFVSPAVPLMGKTIVDALSNGSGVQEMARAKAQFMVWQRCLPVLRSVDLLDRHALRNLSSGQQIVLQCLRALISNKRFLVLDDPFAHLDEQSVHGIRDLLSEHQSEKAILLLTSHPDCLGKWGLSEMPISPIKKTSEVR